MSRSSKLTKQETERVVVKLAEKYSLTEEQALAFIAVLFQQGGTAKSASNTLFLPTSSLSHAYNMESLFSCFRFWFLVREQHKKNTGRAEKERDAPRHKERYKARKNETN